MTIGLLIGRIDRFCGIDGALKQEEMNNEKDKVPLFKSWITGIGW